MRELSPDEKKTITERLLPGSIFDKMFSDRFLKEVKLMIHVREDGRHRFDFSSDTYESGEATEELVNLVDLLLYLSEMGLISKYPPEATTLRDFDVDQDISIGNSTSTVSKVFLLDRASNYVVDFIKEHDNYTFKAKQHLRWLAGHNFASLEERMHDQSLQVANRANRISLRTSLASLLIALVTLGITVYLNRLDDGVKKTITDTKDGLKELKEDQSGFKSTVEKEMRKHQNRIDSVETAMKKHFRTNKKKAHPAN